MAADSRLSSSGQSCRKVRKILRLARKGGIGTSGLVAGSGYGAAPSLLMQWAAAGLKESAKPELEDDANAECLFVRADGTAWLIDCGLTPEELLDDIITLGSGGDLAKGAMLFGATPAEAVAIAIAEDGDCGGPIQVEKL